MGAGIFGRQIRLHVYKQEAVAAVTAPLLVTRVGRRR